MFIKIKIFRTFIQYYYIKQLFYSKKNTKVYTKKITTKYFRTHGTIYNPNIFRKKTSKNYFK